MRSLKIFQTKHAPVQSCPRAETCGMEIMLTNGAETFAVRDGKDKNGSLYRRCEFGVWCSHEHAPAGAIVWHDDAHTEELWEAI